MPSLQKGPLRCVPGRERQKRSRREGTFCFLSGKKKKAGEKEAATAAIFGGKRG